MGLFQRTKYRNYNSLHFMTAGHTKCICDACFGLIRLRYMRSDSQCLQHLAFVCVFINERYKTYQTGFSFCRLGHAPGVGLRGRWGAQGVKKIPNMVMLHIKSTGMTSRTECK